MQGRKRGQTNGLYDARRRKNALQRRIPMQGRKRGQTNGLYDARRRKNAASRGRNVSAKVIHTASATLTAGSWRVKPKKLTRRTNLLRARQTASMTVMLQTSPTSRMARIILLLPETSTRKA
jgi:hypothetical protein